MILMVLHLFSLHILFSSVSICLFAAKQYTYKIIAINNDLVRKNRLQTKVFIMRVTMRCNLSYFIHVFCISTYTKIAKRLLYSRIALIIENKENRKSFYILLFNNSGDYIRVLSTRRHEEIGKIILRKISWQGRTDEPGRSFSRYQRGTFSSFFLDT